ncbi:hypothetical protein PBI_SMARTIES_49 [Microbacterium phage Smarties]|uniref:Uncharacterized protein n=1 Tax=Microbacterium phage Ariadne TaxID=2656546 RepID=A0A649VCC8_9CAUD|nr:hypothetical protein QDA10_gp049 [Microbacterium phage Ariadne]QGJ89453.1 hypothetical protein PBI_ARIADNE_49 [Microbacterium phage Ariadne]QGJ91440.1 hypothetical protein PBI_SMARTIES_49 [Microbacterium phage Smarties]
MTYATIATMANDGYLIQRLTAAAAEEKKDKPYTDWVNARRWDLATTPGWAAAWESAQANGVENIGSNDGVITDAMILAAVQPME